METVLASKISDLVSSKEVNQLKDAQSKIQAISAIQSPIADLEKRLNVKFDPQELNKKIGELNQFVTKNKKEEEEKEKQQATQSLVQQKSKGKEKTKVKDLTD